MEVRGRVEEGVVGKALAEAVLLSWYLAWSTVGLTKIREEAAAIHWH